MFFPGTLEEGIQSALRDKLLVICFVKGADPESEKWETYLKDEAVRVDYVNNIRQNFDEQVGFFCSRFESHHSPDLGRVTGSIISICFLPRTVYA